MAQAAPAGAALEQGTVTLAGDRFFRLSPDSSWVYHDRDSVAAERHQFIRQ
jgi:hypothetical protein